MKKTLFTLGFVAISIFAEAQNNQLTFYSGDVSTDYLNGEWYSFMV